MSINIVTIIIAIIIIIIIINIIIMNLYQFGLKIVQSEKALRLNKANAKKS